MGKFSNLLLYSDVDGTFLDDAGQIHTKNRAAVEYFMEQGGLFGLASGRSTLSIQRILSDTRINAPAILYNGALCYDFQKGEVLHSLPLPSQAWEAVSGLMEHFPSLAIEYVFQDHITCSNINDLTREHLEYEHLAYDERNFTSIPNGCYKVLFVGKPEDILLANNYMDRQEYPHIDYVRSSHYFLELVSKEASKGNALEWIASYLNIPIKNTFAVGDFYNDISMIKAAGCGAFVENAPDEIKTIADIVVAPNTSGSVDNFIEWVEKNILQCRNMG